MIRPWITAWMDWRTRKIVGYVLSAAPDSSMIMAALRVAILDESNFGPPELVWIDSFAEPSHRIATAAPTSDLKG